MTAADVVDQRADGGGGRGRIERAGVHGRTVTLKLRYDDFQIHTRARSAPHEIKTRAAFAALSTALLDEILPLPRPVRLMGLTLSSLEGEPPAEADETDPGAAVQGALPF